MSFRPYIALCLATAAAAAPAVAGPLQITSSMMIEQRSAAADGTTRITLVKPTKVVPGDKVIFVVAYRNTGAQALGNVILANPVPKGMAYRQATPGTQAPELSVDGRTFGTLASLRVPLPGGSTRAAGADDVTNVRWRLANPIPAGAQGQFAFQAVLK